SSDIVLVGIGATTPIGRTAVASAAAVRGGIAGFMDHPYMTDCRGDPFVVAMASHLAPEMPCELRILELARTAADEALSAVPAVMARSSIVTLILGLPGMRPGATPTLASELEAGLNLALPQGFRVSRKQFLPRGHSSGLMAIEAGCRELQDGRSTFA